MSEARRIKLEVEAALKATGLPWRIEQGGKHQKVILNERLIGVMSNSYSGRCNANAKMILAAIKRAMR